MKILVFEDGRWPELGVPALLRPVFEILCGARTCAERAEAGLPDRPFFQVRDYLAGLAREKYPGRVNEPAVFEDDLLMINGRRVFLPPSFPSPGQEEVLVSSADGDILHALVGREKLRRWWDGDFERFLQRVRQGCPVRESEEEMLRFPWDVVRLNPPALLEDCAALEAQGNGGRVAGRAILLGPEKGLSINPDAEVEPLAVLDTRQGRIIIESGALVSSGARVAGPCRIGRGSLVLPGARLRDGCSIGPACRVGGEVEACVLQGYANKYHDGFLGHSWLGEFVNLGAGTVTSDLKNDYSNVGLYDGEKVHDTGLLKLGSIIGDHTKTSIGTLLNTGTSAGIMCQLLAGGGLLPRFFPSFSWYARGRYSSGRGFDDALDTARRAMGRRSVEVTPGLVSALEEVYRVSAPLRRKVAGRREKNGRANKPA